METLLRYVNKLWFLKPQVIAYPYGSHTDRKDTRWKVSLHMSNVEHLAHHGASAADLHAATVIQSQYFHSDELEW